MARRKKRTGRIMGCLLAAGVCGLIALAVGGLWVWRELHIDRRHYPVMGIDVSHHNGTVDYERVRDAGVAFVYIKATEGVTHVDDTFERNARKAGEAGLVVGYYHYFRKHLSGEEQARHFMRTVRGHDMQLPLAVDIEEWYSSQQNIEKELDRLDEMLSVLKREGYKVMLYANHHDYNAYLSERFAGEELWLSFFLPPRLVLDTPRVMQQYTFTGSVSGVEGDVDLDVFVGSRAEWQQWLDKNKM